MAMTNEEAAYWATRQTREVRAEYEERIAALEAENERIAALEAENARYRQELQTVTEKWIAADKTILDLRQDTERYASRIVDLRRQLAQTWVPIPAAHLPMAHDHNLILDYDGKNRRLTLVCVTPIGYDNVVLAYTLPETLDLCRRQEPQP